MECYLALMKKMKFARKWMELEKIKLIGETQSQKD